MAVKNNRLTIVSRKSKLALTQAEIVRSQLQDYHPKLKIEVIGISTRGDQILDQPLNKIGGKGLFVNELEQYLLEGKADMAVHSMKDMPANITAGLDIGAILKRADVRDVLVCRQFADIASLPHGSIVGTSSLRREAQVLAINPHLVVHPLRGNVETRLKKLLEGKYSAIILAAAGLARLGLNEWLRYPIDPQHMLPAVGQGALGVEYNLEREDIRNLLCPLHDETTGLCVAAERALNATLGGGCTAPIAGLARIENNVLTLQALVADVDLYTSLKVAHSGPKHTAQEIGQEAALQLIARGAHELILKSQSKMK